MRRFEVPDLRAGELRLDAARSHHLLHVLRTPRGAVVGLADSAGRLGEGELVAVDDGIAVLRITSAARAALPARVVLLGVPRPALVEEAVTLGTECGATRFLLTRASRSPPAALRLDRLTRVVAAAATQCGRGAAPTLTPCDSLAAALDALPAGARYVATPGAGTRAGTPHDAVVAVGPEGGWTPAEQIALEAANFVPLGLGPHVLRAPTAVAAALLRLLPDEDAATP